MHQGTPPACMQLLLLHSPFIPCETDFLSKKSISGRTREFSPSFFTPRLGSLWLKGKLSCPIYTPADDKLLQYYLPVRIVRLSLHVKVVMFFVEEIILF